MSGLFLEGFFEGFGIDGVEEGEGDRVPVAGGFAEPPVGPVFAGVLVEFLAPAEDRPILAGVVRCLGNKAQGTMAVKVVLGVNERACPFASVLDIGNAFRLNDGVVFPGSEEGLCVSVFLAHPRARVRRAEAYGTNSSLAIDGL